LLQFFAITEFLYLCLPKNGGSSLLPLAGLQQS
jgi:hypothetical protein